MGNRMLSADEAVSIIRSGDRVFLHTAAATPQRLIEAMVGRAGELRNVEIVSLHTEGDAPYVRPEYQESFRLNAFFVGKNVRKAVQEGYADAMSIFLSDVPSMFHNRILPLDIALVHVSPPDRHGYCSLGVSVDASLAAVHNAKQVIAQVNPLMPRTHGEGLLHMSKIHAMVAVNDPLPETPRHELTEIEQNIGRHIASIVEDGATLQMGIGAIPDATLAALGSHKDIGIHTEMFSDGVVDLIEKGVITGRKKKTHKEIVVASFLVGSRRLYDFVDDNPLVEMLPSDYVNDTKEIRKNPKVTAINSAIEIDMSGQVCADSIGHRHFSGVGGQMDFIRGAALSEGGKPIIALPSTTRKGESRIVPHLKPGAGVVTTRAHVHYIVTEYGIVNLHGKNLRQRAEALASIAHPDYREEICRSARDLYGQKSYCGE
ncbi:MAG: 4-hydroxybutyrate CoA-transferase [Chlorobium sp.]|jgi:acyl-CoA hydrolase|uniref:acetyl-CoA hydrolase/transferase family protein n=1 Tax=Chlorobium sp. TaxID=1095 RepID=UPI001D9C6073|nr:acetyl-CoA hydrolase/transferase C-terminal domain-containing protein [Chlorobium sp.]MBN1279021.1 acetyl-CoA hydrolase/transferase family protein [Chlorobiaceae bacterium]MCF8216300.1 4-hydroxybutyrate CoA-transferase [Chlorobium sp.]MCF8271202.1 4-hydroxybutyrate CoA-transferase [Chlorobium sp.]MCF8287576.1 4-hydroxybutyrate CoA-transferase [Chlorobium sp.]MCF8291115.1 4-hydroxybutyrate CoA-transferase [Chlorobium sp.]